MASMESISSRSHVLVVDLDGTLIKTDLLYESASYFLIRQPFRALQLVVWLAQGKAALKTQLAQCYELDAATLPYNETVLAWLRKQKASGRSIVLATASHRLLAEQVSAYLGLFDAVLATDEKQNLHSISKRDMLVKRYGEHSFDYVGNGRADVPVWEAARASHVVSSSKPLIEKVKALGNWIQTLGDNRPTSVDAMFKAVRPHQWMKNLLILVPLFAAHQYVIQDSLIQASTAFVVFGLTASSVYLLNDIADVSVDRSHPRKRDRPFAAGHLSLLHGWIAWPLLLILAFVLSGLLLPSRFTASLSIYFSLTVAYSLRLKKIAVIDVLTLAALYTLRIIAGAAAIRVPLSFWLLSFSMFLFLSLAFIKRYSELQVARDTGSSDMVAGRGYSRHDLELVSSLGGSSGYIAVLVLALYIQDSHTASLYATPQFIWLACPLLLFWVSRAWLIAHRGCMHDDPVVFALKDRMSWAVAALFAAVFWLARVGA